MPLRIRTPSVKIGPARVRLGKKGASVSVGGLSVGPRGVRARVRLAPGVSYETRLDRPARVPVSSPSGPRWLHWLLVAGVFWAGVAIWFPLAIVAVLGALVLLLGMTRHAPSGTAYARPVDGVFSCSACGAPVAFDAERCPQCAALFRL